MSPLNWQEEPGERLASFADFRDRYGVGDVVEGRVSQVVPFGAFVRVDGYDGLLVGSDHGLEVGATVSARIAGIDTEKERFSLTAA
jgi:small subunit ribosomal protein S1